MQTYLFGVIKTIARKPLLQCLICRSCYQWFSSYGKNRAKMPKPIIAVAYLRRFHTLLATELQSLYLQQF